MSVAVDRAPNVASEAAARCGIALRGGAVGVVGANWECDDVFRGVRTSTRLRHGKTMTWSGNKDSEELGYARRQRD